MAVLLVDMAAKPSASRERVDVVPLVRRTDTHLSSRHQAFSVSSAGVSFLVRGRCIAEMSKAETKPITAQSAANSQVVLNASITGACESEQCIRRMELTIAQRIREVEHSDQRCSLERDAKQEDGDVRTGKAPCFEQAEVHYWLALPYLNHNKEDHAPHCRTEERQNGHRGPTPLVSLDDRQHETNDRH